MVPVENENPPLKSVSQNIVAILSHPLLVPIVLPKVALSHILASLPPMTACVPLEVIAEIKISILSSQIST